MYHDEIRNRSIAVAPISATLSVEYDQRRKALTTEHKNKNFLQKTCSVLY